MTPLAWLVLAFATIAFGGTALTGGYDRLAARWQRRHAHRPGAVAAHAPRVAATLAPRGASSAAPAAERLTSPGQRPRHDAPTARRPRVPSRRPSLRPAHPRRPAAGAGTVVQPMLFADDAFAAGTGHGPAGVSRRAIASRQRGGVPLPGTGRVVTRRLGTAVQGG